MLFIHRDVKGACHTVVKCTFISKVPATRRARFFAPEAARQSAASICALRLRSCSPINCLISDLFFDVAHDSFCIDEWTIPEKQQSISKFRAFRFNEVEILCEIRVGKVFRWSNEVRGLECLAPPCAPLVKQGQEKTTEVTRVSTEHMCFRYVQLLVRKPEDRMYLVESLLWILFRFRQRRHVIDKALVL